MLLFFDIETTGIDASSCEVIEAYFELHSNKNKIDSYYFKSRVDEWSSEAAKVHKIRKKDMLTYPSKKEAYLQLIRWLHSLRKYKLVLYSNPNNFGDYYHFDIAVIKMQLFYIWGNHTLFYKYFSDDIHNVWQMAHEAYNKKVIQISKHTKLSQFSQENVTLNIFNERYKAHRCYSDVQALIKLYYYIKERLDTNQGLLI